MENNLLSKNYVAAILEENKRRQPAPDIYDPIAGIGCVGERKRVKIAWEPEYDEVLLPVSMLEDPEMGLVTSPIEYHMLRNRHDFEYWAATCVKIRHKATGEMVWFVLNRAQRKLLAEIEADRVARRPIRIILLKARQWGGSTLVQMYFAWMQTVLHRDLHSIICAHVKDTASQIRGMYSTMLKSYPEVYWDGDKKPALKPYQGSANTREIEGRGCRITLASSFGQDAVRGHDCALAHLSEVAFWKDTGRLRPVDLVRSVCGGILARPNTFIALESTANGVGNFFHTEWLRARNGRSMYRPVFVPWYEIEIYRKELDNPAEIAATLSDYERHLWSKGLTLEQIAWYRTKLKEFPDEHAMMAEYPSDDSEAFANTGHNVFAVEHINRLCAGCCEPREVGDIVAKGVTGRDALKDVRFVPSSNGKLKIWRRPQKSSAMSNRYVVTVDVGGRSSGSDYSVIAVIDQRGENNRPEIVAQWRGHTDYDLLGWRAASIAKWYGDALLVIESNSLESAYDCGSEFILNELVNHYPNLYFREATEGNWPLPGFHTNRSTKGIVVAKLVAIVREGAYTERDKDACSEMATYEELPNGSYAARDGSHDDILMTRAIGLYIASLMPEYKPLKIKHFLRRLWW